MVDIVDVLFSLIIYLLLFVYYQLMKRKKLFGQPTTLENWPAGIEKL